MKIFRAFKIVLTLYVFALLFSCDTDNNWPPRDFDVFRIVEYFEKIDLKWTESTDPENSLVTYDVYIKENIKGSSYKLQKNYLNTDFKNGRYEYSFTIENLEDGKNWEIKITATDQDGKSREKIVSASTKPILDIPIGISDSLIPFPAFSRVAHTVTEFKGKLWLVGGYKNKDMYNDIWSSNDGINWELVTDNAPFEKRANHASFVLDNKLWIMGGYDAPGIGRNKLMDVWVSEDGTNWENVASNANLPNPNYHTVELNNKIWLFSENNNSINPSFNRLYESSDGLTWVENTSFNFGTIYPQDVKIFDDKIWFVDESTSIKSWDPVTNETEVLLIPRSWNTNHYFLREEQELGIVRNSLFIIGGISSSTPLRDIWSSTNGIDWTFEKNLGQSQRRYRHQSVSFKDKIVTIGGKGEKEYLDTILILE